MHPDPNAPKIVEHTLSLKLKICARAYVSTSRVCDRPPCRVRDETSEINHQLRVVPPLFETSYKVSQGTPWVNEYPVGDGVKVVWHQTNACV